MKQDAFFQTIIHHIGGEGNVARKRFDGEHLYVTVKDSGMADLEELNLSLIHISEPTRP